MGAHGVPVEAAGVAADDVPRGLQRQGFRLYAKGIAEKYVHLVLGKPQREGGRVARIFVELYAVELRQGDGREGDDGHGGNVAECLPDAYLKLAQALIGDDEEVAASACRVKEFDFRQPVEQRLKSLCGKLIADFLRHLFARFGTRRLKLLVERVEKERTDYLLYVRHRGIVHAESRALFGRYHSLNHRPEDVGVDFAPVVIAAVEDEAAGSARQPRDGEMLPEQPSVDVREYRIELGQHGSRRLVVGRHYQKGTVDELRQVAAVLLGVVAQSVGEEVLSREKTRVLGKETEKESRHKHVERMHRIRVAYVVVAADVIEELGHQLSRFYISLSLGDVLNLFNAC